MQMKWRDAFTPWSRSAIDQASVFLGTLRAMCTDPDHHELAKRRESFAHEFFSMRVNGGSYRQEDAMRLPLIQPRS